MRARTRRWRRRQIARLANRSWPIAKLWYRLAGLPLGGAPTDPVWYFAFGSNMRSSVFIERRGMQPTAWRVGRLPDYRLRFNLDGRPKGRAAPANIAPAQGEEVWGVLFKITQREMVRLNATEGVPGRVYRPTYLTVYDENGHPQTAMTYVADGNPEDGRPSLRYITLLREGAREYGLPASWQAHMDQVVPAE